MLEALFGRLSPATAAARLPTSPEVAPAPPLRSPVALLGRRRVCRAGERGRRGANPGRCWLMALPGRTTIIPGLAWYVADNGRGTVRGGTEPARAQVLLPARWALICGQRAAADAPRATTCTWLPGRRPRPHKQESTPSWSMPPSKNKTWSSL